MTLSRIVMRLARNPGTEFAGGDDHRGYALTAPLTADGLLDLEAYGKTKAECVVRRFAPDEDAADGRLARRGSRWFFDYDEGDWPMTSRSTASASIASQSGNTSR